VGIIKERQGKSGPVEGREDAQKKVKNRGFNVNEKWEREEEGWGYKKESEK
jgi:hypothetical protein